MPKPFPSAALHVKSLLHQKQTTEEDPCGECGLSYSDSLEEILCSASHSLLFHVLAVQGRVLKWKEVALSKHSVSKKSKGEKVLVLVSKNVCVYMCMFCTTCVCVCVSGGPLSSPGGWTSIDSSDSGSGCDTSSLLSCRRGKLDHRRGRGGKRKQWVKSVKQQDNKLHF